MNAEVVLGEIVMQINCCFLTRSLSQLHIGESMFMLRLKPIALPPSGQKVINTAV